MASPDRSAVDRAYLVVVAFKGVDGAVELLLGLLLLLAPSTAERLLTALAAEVGEGSTAWQVAAAGYLGNAAVALDGTSIGVVVFLLVHGAVKLVTVYCLIRRIMRLYPWAIGVLAVLSVVQLQAAIARPTVGAWVLTALDLVVIALVAQEYRRLRAQSRTVERQRPTAQPASRRAV